MRLAWLAVLACLTTVVLFVVLGGGGWKPSSEMRALAGTCLGIALSAIVTNINAALAERSARQAIKTTTLSDQLDMALNMGVISVLLQQHELTPSSSKALQRLLSAVVAQADAIAARLGEKHPKRNLAAQRLKLSLVALEHEIANGTVESLR